MEYPPCKNGQTLKDCMQQRVNAALSEMDSGRGTNRRAKKSSLACPSENSSKCTLKKAINLTRTRDSSYLERKKGACQGDKRLAKKAFISMIGPPSFSSAVSTAGNAEVQAAKILTTIEEQGGDIRKASAILGITIQSLKRKLNPAQSAAVPYDESGSTNLTRRYFENLKSDWEIVSFNTFNGEVCVDARSKSTVTRLSATIKALK